MKTLVEKDLDTVIDNFMSLKLQSDVISKIANICIEALKNGCKIVFCGNGGSAADSQHLASELVGKYKLNRKAYNAIALTTDTSLLTAVGNDLGFERIFERQIEGLCQKGDVLIALSTSGTSPNIVCAVAKAKAIGMTSILLTGASEKKAVCNADIVLKTPSCITNNIQEMHIAVGHIVCDYIEKNMEKV